MVRVLGSPILTSQPLPLAALLSQPALMVSAGERASTRTVDRTIRHLRGMISTLGGTVAIRHQVILAAKRLHDDVVVLRAFETVGFPKK
jgi:hypothetical protein